MGFFSDMLKMAASEVVNAVMEGVNEATNVQEEKERHLQELREQYSSVSYEILDSMSTYDKFDNDEIALMKTLMEERNQLAKTIIESPDEAFQEFDDEDLVAFYEKLLRTEGGLFPDQYVKKLIRLFQNEVLSRPIAKRIHEQNNVDCFEDKDYDELETIVLGNSVFIDDVLKAEAINELECRNSIIESLEPDVIDELDNNEFMQIYSIVRSDKAKCTYEFTGTENIITGQHHSYFGEHQRRILKNCENEILTNRKYLIRKFLSEYCENEFEEYSNYSNKKLASIIEYAEAGCEEVAYDYDLCDKLIAQSILSERGGE